MRLSRPFEVVTPTVDGNDLAVLGRANGPFSGRQVHRHAGRHSEAGIRKALDRLVEQGIVVRRRVGNTHLHSLNDSDIDVLLVPPAGGEDEEWRAAVSGFVDSLSKATGNDVRVLELAEGELWAPGNEALRKEVLRDTIVLLGSRSMLTRSPR